jgi:microcystin-dependent protein
MDISAVNWNEVDASNTAAAPDGSPEGMSPSGVNNVLRAHQGAIKRWYNHTIPAVTTGTASAFILGYSVPPTALTDGDSHTVTFHAANAAGATLNVNLLGDKPLHYYSAGAWRLVPAALWGADQIRRVAYHSASGAYRLLDLDDRTGVVEAFAGATAPAGSLLCFGQAISRTAYAGLFAVLSTDHGVGDGSATFNLPDLRGRVGAGKSDMGGSDAGNLTGGATLGAGLGGQSTSTSGTGSGSASINGNTFGPSSTTTATGGAVTVGAGDHGHNMSFNAPVTVAITTAAFGIVQPTRVLNYVIRI